jgi:twitching motility protein PilT
MLAESLRGVIAQTLLPKADGTGRVAALEIMHNNPAIANLIREGKTFQIPNTMQTSRNEGMVTFEQYVHDLMKKGIVAPATYLEATGRKASSLTQQASSENTSPGTSTPSGTQTNATVKVPGLPPLKKSG